MLSVLKVGGSVLRDDACYAATAEFLKARNPTSVVKLKDLQSGEEIVVAFKAGE